MGHSRNPIVVGVDGTQDALNAARWAAAVAARLGESLHLVHVMRGIDEALLAITAPQHADGGAYARQQGQAVLDRVADAVRTDDPGLLISWTLSHLTPAKALTEQSWRARMVVLACADVSPAGALLVGSTTLAVANRSACPVVAWRGGALAPTGQPIVVGVVEGRTSQAALTAAFGLADALGVGLTAVCATSPRRAPGAVDCDGLERHAQRRLLEIVAPAVDRWPDVDVAYVVEKGRPSRVLLHHAVGAQLVVVGSRGHGQVVGALLGSTGLSLLHHSPAPVVLCPASHAEDESTLPADELVNPLPGSSQ